MINVKLTNFNRHPGRSAGMTKTRDSPRFHACFSSMILAGVDEVKDRSDSVSDILVFDHDAAHGFFHRDELGLIVICLDRDFEVEILFWNFFERCLSERHVDLFWCLVGDDAFFWVLLYRFTDFVSQFSELMCITDLTVNI